MTLQDFVHRLPAPLRRHKLLQLLVRLPTARPVQTLRYNCGARARVDLRDANARTYFIRGEFEPEFFAIAAPFLAGGGTWFDVGANFGLCTFGLLRRCAPAQIDCHLFEANPWLGLLLRDSAALHPGARLRINTVCVSDEEGSALLRVTPDLGSSYIAADGSERVPAIRLDDYVAGQRFGRIHLLKIDIEGFEPRALRGARKLLGAGQVDAVYFEVSTANLRRQGFTVDDALEPLRTAGYTVFLCKPADLRRAPGPPQTLEVNGLPIPVAPLVSAMFPGDLQTDLLAVHPALLRRPA